jgi:acetolactate synthase small subunit
VDRAELLAVASGHKTMEHVVQWTLRRGFSIESIVVQDEYTHDVVVRVHEHFLVYDTT